MVVKDSAEFDEKYLIKSAKKGNRDAFGALVRQFSKPVYYLAYRFTRDHDVSDELTQECFVKAYQAMDSFIEGKSFKSWVFAIVSNLAINYLKKQKRQVSLDDDISESVLEDTRASSNPHDDLVAKDLKVRISEAVERLPEEFKTVFILRTYEDMSYEEISSMLKIEKGTVMSRLFRARARLKRELKGYLDE
jgi:RNA polymerase sigma-70 factor, ECF subfamily